MLSRGENPLGAEDSPLLRFAADLRRLRQKAGRPTYRELSSRAHFSVAALSEAANGRQLPSLAVTLAYVAACDGEVDEWRTRWQAVVDTRDTLDTTTAPSMQNGSARSPYRGLAAFQPSDADLFFGRETVIEDLQARLRTRRFLGVFGASGSGKSSVLRAGLVAESIARGQPVLLFTPGPHPFEECAVHLADFTGDSAVSLLAELAAAPEHLHLRIRQAMAHHGGDVDLLVVVDQFEEIFTLCQENEERDRFISALVAAAIAETSRVRIVVGVRADFYGHCGHHPDLVAALRDGQILLGPLNAEQLRQVITAPAAARGFMVESALVTRLTADAAGQTAALSLLSHALLETWRRRRGATLTVAGYESAGGIRHGISRTAEDLYVTLDGDQREVARHIFLRLIALDGAKDTKRRVHPRELDTGNHQTGDVLEWLARARLIVLDDESVEVAHEALICSWPRLREWLDDDREGLRVHRQLTEATDVWESLDHDPGALYRGARLDIAQHWTRSHEDALTVRELEFLRSSTDMATADRAAARRRARRLGQLVAVLTVLLVVAAGTTVAAIRAQHGADQQRDLALAHQAATTATALRATDPALAAQLGLAAYHLADTPQTRDTVLDTFATPYASRVVGHTAAVNAVAFSPDGHILATGSSDDTARLWNIANPSHPRAIATIPGHTQVVYAVAFSPDGHTLAIGGSDGTTRLWDVTTPSHPRITATITGHTDSVFAVAFSRMGDALATGSGDGTVRLWDVSTPSHPHAMATLTGHTGMVWSLAFSPDGHTLATGSLDGGAQLWSLGDASRPILLATVTDAINAVAFSPDGHTLATAARDNTARLWDVTTPAQPHAVATLTGHTRAIWSLAFSPDGHTIAAAGDDKTTLLWQIGATSQPLATVTGHTGTIYAVAFSPDGRTLATGSGDRTARLADLSTVAFTYHTDAINAVAVSPDGRGLVTASTDRGVQLWDVTDRYRPRETAVLATATTNAVAVSPDSHLLATAGDDTSARLWDISDRSHPRVVASITDAAIAEVAFSPVGKVLATAGADKTVRLWDVTEPSRPRPLGTLTGYPGPVRLVVFSADGRRLASSGGLVWLWDISDLRHPRHVASIGDGTASVRGVRFSPTAPTLVTAFDNSPAQLWNVTNLARPRRLAALTSYPDPVTALAISPDGRTLATTSTDDTVRLWDITRPAQPAPGPVLAGHTDTVTSAVFSPDGHTVTTISNDNTIRLWQTTLDQVTARICDLADPPITRTEWDQNFPGLPYTPPCP